MNKSIAIKRREAQIKDLVARIVTFDISNSDVIDPTVVDCELSNDLSHLKIYMAFGSRSQKGIEALEKAKGFVRKVLASSLNWRKVPELHFVLDEVTNYGNHIDEILKQIKEEN